VGRVRLEARIQGRQALTHEGARRAVYRRKSIENIMYDLDRSEGSGGLDSET